MALPESIRRAWTVTDYRVRLPRGGFVSIRVGAALPESLRALLRGDAEAWGFITAWNPFSVARPRAINRHCQRELRDVVRDTAHIIRAGIGVGADGWCEPSLFVVGTDFEALDALARRFNQAAIVRGIGAGAAELHALL